jgi:predicted amidohydrolase
MLSAIDSSVNRRRTIATPRGEPVRAAAVQLNATPDKARNLETADRLVRRAAADGAQLVVLPEKWSVLGRGSDLREGAEPLDGPAIAWARDVARELGLELVAGSVSERVPGEDKLRNTSLHIGPDGEIKAAYRKVHMFDVEVDGTQYRESEHEAPGDEIVLSETADGVRLGLTVCYDVRFPELYRILAVRGAQVITVPAAFTLPTTRDHWEVLVRARAIEDQCFVVAPNQIGRHAEGLRSGGRSMIVDPWGLVLAQAPDAETVITADLDLDALADMRARLPALANRRPSAYRWPES